MKELIVIEPQSVAKVFAQGGTLPLVAIIENEVATFKPNVTTASGRKEIASWGHKVARSKTYVDNAGKEFCAEIKAKTKAIDAERKFFRDKMDVIKEKIRQPLTDWENAEKDRVAKHNKNLEHIREFDYNGYLDTKDIKDAIAKLENIPIDDSWEEFFGQAGSMKNTILLELKDKLAESIRKEKEQEELERKIRLQEEQDRKDRDERIKREAEEKAKLAAENARIEAEKVAHTKELEAKGRELELKLKLERAEREKVEAQERAEMKIKQRQQQEEEAEKVRMADKEHQRSINREIVDDCLRVGIDKEKAQNLIKSIIIGTIRHLSIKY